MSSRAILMVAATAALVGAAGVLGSCAQSAAEDPLPSWRRIYGFEALER